MTETEKSQIDAMDAALVALRWVLEDIATNPTKRIRVSTKSQVMKAKNLLEAEISKHESI